MEKSLITELISLRKALHAFPELSTEEYNTQQKILDFLNSYGILSHRKIGKTGILVDFNTGAPGLHLMIRADIDALPILEVNTFDHKSTRQGISHKCGHDGHTAILCGLAVLLKNELPAAGRISLLFQPAEENGMGAVSVLTDPAFDINPDFVFALHNLPGYELHQVICRPQAFTAAVKSIIIKLYGKTSHAAEPELGINPARAMSKFIEMFGTLSKPDPACDDFRLCTPVHMTMGEKAYGISAGYGEVHYTIRSWHNTVMTQLCDDLTQQIESICNDENLTYSVEWTQEFAANQNHPVAVRAVQSAAEKLELKYQERPYPFKWGEDFGLFTERFPGAMFGIGSGTDHSALHNPDYDFPDEIIPTGINLFALLIKQILNEQ